jgi:prevent-host-death family protein
MSLNDYMREIGVRDLKANLSDALRRVDQGEPIRVTVRGRPVADLVPTGTTGTYERLRTLVAKGRVTPASASRPGHRPRPVRASRSALALILSGRDAER